MGRNVNYDHIYNFFIKHGRHFAEETAKSNEMLTVKYILYQVKHGVRLEDVLKNLGYVKESKK